MNYSKESYRHLLELSLHQGYEFISFLDERDTRNRCIYLRHDVHWSFNAALELAKINNSMDIQGTFCLLLRSRLYNLLSSLSLDFAHEIHALGQHLAFHFVMPSGPTVSYDELEALILTDFNTVKNYLPEIEPVFSWHNPTPELISRGLHLEVSGLINCFSARFFKDIPYYSDSLMRYTVTEFEKIICQEDCRAMQLLFHPDHWIPGGANLVETLAGNWQYAIRELEYELRQIRIVLPDGMPDQVLQDFAEQWRRAAENYEKS